MSTLDLFSRLKNLGIKFYLVNNHLKINAPEGTLNPALLAEIKAKRDEIIDFLKKHVQKHEKFASIGQVEEKEYYPLSSAQKRLFIVHQMQEESIGYNIPSVLELIGTVDRERMTAAFRGLLERHESLRTSFRLEAEEPVQRVHRAGDIDFGIEYYKLRSRLSSEGLMAGEEINRIINGFIHPFDLCRAPLLRVGLIEKTEDKSILMLDMHHIISDGTSIGILRREFMALYGGEKLPPLRLQYKDYSVWQGGDSQVEAVKGQESFWLNQFSGRIPLINLPTDYPRPPVQGFMGKTIYFKMGEGDTKALQTLAAAEDVTLYMVVLSIYNILLSKLSGQEDIIVGTPIAGRRHDDLQHIIGMFVNTLVLRNYPAADKTFREFLREVKVGTLAAFENQGYPFENLVDKLVLNRDTARNPLFDVMFALLNMDMLGEDSPVLTMRPYDYEIGTVKFDLALNVMAGKDELLSKIEYSTGLFIRETIDRFILYFKEIVSFTVKEPDIELRHIEVIPGEEKERLLYDFNDTALEYPRHKTIQQLFAEQTERRPDSIAIVAWGEPHCWIIKPEAQVADIQDPGKQPGEEKVCLTLSYRELAERAARMAELLAAKGLKPGAIVGLMLEPSLEMIIALLGILKAGGAYLPIDPDYPGDRIQYMLLDSNARLLLTGSSLIRGVTNNTSIGKWQGETIFCGTPTKEGQPPGLPQKSPHLPLTFADPIAYIIYTSGSTGRPKGVMVEQRNVVRLVKNSNFMDFHEGQRLLMTGSFVFDVTTLEIWGSLLNGMSLHLVDRGVIMDVDQLRDAVVKNEISVLHLIPQLFYQLLDQHPQAFARLEYFLVGGDLVRPQPVTRLRRQYSHIKIIHAYGPTENTTFSTTFRVDKDYEERLPIGKPIGNSSVYILDRFAKLQPLGVPGELYTGGEGIARGYLKNPELTADKFVKNLYRTGDLARWLPDGNIEFLGRMDHQVKIRGIRIELEEIENHLLKHKEIKEVVVTVREDNRGDKYLCAYIVPGHTPPGPDGIHESSVGTAAGIPGLGELRQYLSQTLPDYLVPSCFVQLEKIPLTSIGKVDGRALPAPEFRTGEDYAAPGSNLERKLVEIWAEVLGIEKEKIGVNDSFFDLGGHSLKATILTAKLHKEFGIKVPLTEIFKIRSIKDLSLYLDAAVRESYTPIPAAEEKEYYSLSSAQGRFYILQQVTPASTAYNMPAVFQVQGKVEKEKFETALHKLIHRHESLRTSFRIIENQPVQRIHDPQALEFEIEWAVLSGSSPWQRQRAASIIERFFRPFDLCRAPLFRFGLFKAEEEIYVLMFDIHHIISDGTSVDIFLREFMILYSGGELQPLRLQYKDFAQWQYNRLKSGKLKKQEEYWSRRFAAEVPVLNMPTDYPRPRLQSFEGDSFDFMLEKELSRHLDHLIKKTGTTLNIVLLAIFNILLSKYTGQEDIVIGTTIAGREHSDLESIIGLLIETLALRNFPLGGLTFEQFLHEVRESTLAAYENQAYPFKELIKKVGAENEISRNPVFDAMLIVQNIDSSDFELEGLRISPYVPHGEESRRMSKVDFTVEAVETREGIHFVLEYCTSLYSRETMERFVLYFVNIITQVVQESTIELSAIDMIGAEEKRRLLAEFNAAPRETGTVAQKPIHLCFSDQVKKTPDHVAVQGVAISSYSQLNDLTNHLACLLKERGVKPDTIVGVMVDSSLEMVSALLGILKSGAAYLPIEPDYPMERISYMLSDSGAKILVTSRNSFKETGKPGRWAGETIFVEEIGTRQEALGTGVGVARWDSQDCSVENLAYVIYTSGTTGRPKGVAVAHSNLAAYVEAFENEFELSPADTVIQQVSYAFDAFVEELYPILVKGGKLAIAGKEVIRDIHALCTFIAKHQVTLITCSPQLLNELDKPGNANLRSLQSLRILISGGDRLKAEYIGNLLETGEVYNTYGPTETTVCATYYRCSKHADLPANVPIGSPITNYQVYILDKYGSLLPVGIPGELCIAGPGVTRGYLNRPELTAEKFLNAKSDLSSSGPRAGWYAPGGCRQRSGPRLYRSGDLARWLPQGSIEFLCRIDRQVKIRGYRIELAEIENRLTALENIKEAVVTAGEKKSGQNYLAAYVVCEGAFDVAELKSQLARQLPDYMIPPYITALEEIPLTGSGKPDHKRLPPADVPADRAYAAPGSKTEKTLAGIWQEVLELERVGLDDNFFDLGGTSLDIFKINTRIEEEFKKQIPVVSLFQHSTVRSLARFLKDGEEKGIPEAKQQEFARSIDKGKKIMKKTVKRDVQGKRVEALATASTAGIVSTGLEIAVIGAACIFPGATNLDEFWDNLQRGIDSIAFFSDDELFAEGIDTDTLENPNYIKAKGIIARAGYFDNSFFGYTPREAQIMDPQMRIFTQCTWHALEDAGYDPLSFDRPIGLYAGASPNLYWEGLTSFAGVSQGVSGFLTAQLADKDFMCTHISYKLNLKGPSYAVQTACSTSLVAIHMAVQGLLHGECGMALAGGVSIVYPQIRGYMYQEGMIFSGDGHNRTFAAGAKGSVFGDGVGVVVLKTLDDAVAARDHIYAVIKGSATNNDGFRKPGYTAPSIDGQAEVIKAAQLMAEVEPESITYIETHGTATPLGDSVEIEALKKAFNTDKRRFCAIGAVKSNVGHLYSAAGAAGFIKTLLSLKHRFIPPSLHFNIPNPQIDFENSPFYVARELKEWKSDGCPLRAGVSSFGIGGTNAHIILEEAPQQIIGSGPGNSRRLKLLLLSAKTGYALNQLTENIINYLKENPQIDFADAAYTLQVGRKHFPYRRMAVMPTLHLVEEADKLSLAARRTQIVLAREEKRPVFFMICGQGSQYVDMGLDLYRTEPVFREEIDRCFEILKPLVGHDLKEVLYPGLIQESTPEGVGHEIPAKGKVPTRPAQGHAADIHQTFSTQPILFAFEYALAKLLMAWGITPTAMIGYSFGEYLAACLAGVFSLEDALKLVIIRGQLSQRTPAGAMTSVPLMEQELEPLLNDDLSLAIVNGPTCIVSGAREAVAAFEKDMKDKRILCVPLNMSHAFHSHLMTPIREEFEARIGEFRLNKPQIPYISNVTGRWIGEEEAVNPGYWGEHLCSPVRFSHGLKELLKEENAIFIEVGPGRILGMMVRVHPDKKPGQIILNIVKHPQEKISDDHFLLDKVGQLWLHGQSIDWIGFYGEEKRCRISLPGYPFEGKRYWLDANALKVGQGVPLVSQVFQTSTGPESSSAEPGYLEGLEAFPGNYAAPRNEFEEVTARLWQEQMGIERPGIHDDFFYLNGSSLVATQIIAQLQQKYELEIPIDRFYEKPTIAHLAEVIKELQVKKEQLVMPG